MCSSGPVPPPEAMSDRTVLSSRAINEETAGATVKSWPAKVASAPETPGTPYQRPAGGAISVAERLPYTPTGRLLVPLWHHLTVRKPIVYFYFTVG